MVPRKSDIQKALASGDHKIGDLVWYDCRNAHITPGNLKKLFNNHGLDEKHFPDDIKPKHAFQKACRKAMVDDSSSSDTRHSVAKLIVDGMDKLVYGIVDLDVNKQLESISPDFADTVWLDKDALTAHHDKGHPMAKAVVATFNKMCGEYITRDISRMIVRSLDRMASVSMREAGVIYFVPATYEKDLQALKAVVNDIGQCNMQVFEIASGQQTGVNSQQIEKVARSQFLDRVKQMKADIADLKSSIDSETIKGKTIDKSVEVRLKRYRELRDKCSVLSDSLKIKADDLLAEIDTVGKLIKDELMQAAA